MNARILITEDPWDGLDWETKRNALVNLIDFHPDSKKLMDRFYDAALDAGADPLEEDE